MGEFTAAAESVLSAETVALETPVETGSIETAPAAAPVADDTPASDLVASGDPSTEAPPAAALPQTTTTRDPHGRFAGKTPGPPSTIPYQRFQEVTRKASEREKEVTALKERFGWIGDQELPVFRQFWDAYKANPAQAFLNELPLLLRSTKYGAQMRQALAEMIGEQKAAAPAPDPKEEEPHPDFYQDDDSGQRHWFYSAAQQAKHRAWQAKQQQQELAPIIAFQNELREERVLGRLQAEATRTAADLVTPLKSSPYFEPHREAIRAKFRQYAPALGGAVALHRAYAEVLQEVVIPSLSTQDRRALASSLQAKTGASNPNPARPGVSTGGVKPPADFREAAERILAGQR